MVAGSTALDGRRGHLDKPGLDLPSDTVARLNQLLGDIEWEDDDRVQRFITEQSPQEANADSAYRNVGEHSDEQNARIKHDLRPTCRDDGHPER